MKILQAANFVSPASGGLRTTLAALARGYTAAGHEVVRIVLGARDRVLADGGVTVVELAAPRIPRLGGYRIVPPGRRLDAVLDRLSPDRVEVSDRLSLLRVGTWARRHGVPAVAMVHERLDALLGLWLPGRRIPRRVADRLNRRVVAAVDTIVCSSTYARAGLDRIGAPAVEQIPLGVDLQLFHPARRSPALRRTLAPDGGALLALCSRLSPEKQPLIAIETVRTLQRRGHDVRLVVAGDGPLMARCRRTAADLPVTFLGFVADRARLAELLATSDVVLAPGPVETFGLAALEALASGTPVVGRRGGALDELLPADAIAFGHPAAFATAVATHLARDEATRRVAARVRAARYGWERTVDRMLATHGLLQAAEAFVASPPRRGQP